MSVAKKQQYVPIGLTVLGELSSKTLGKNIYLSDDFNGMTDATLSQDTGFAYPGWENDPDVIKRRNGG